jgi:hypothetical protein
MADLTFSKIPLAPSGTPGTGTGILITATATAGTAIHTAGGAGTTDELWLWAHNTHTAALTLNIEFGGTGVPNVIPQTIPNAQGLVLVVPGLILVGNASPPTVAGFTGTTGSKVVVLGYVNRIS